MNLDAASISGPFARIGGWPQRFGSGSCRFEFSGAAAFAQAGKRVTPSCVTIRLWAYTYDAENRITSASGMSGGPYCYVYDGDGLRVEKFNANGGTCASPSNKVVDALYWRSVTGQTIAETNGSGSTLSEYVFFSGERIGRLDSSGNVY